MKKIFASVLLLTVFSVFFAAGPTDLRPIYLQKMYRNTLPATPSIKPVSIDEVETIDFEAVLSEDALLITAAGDALACEIIIESEDGLVVYDQLASFTDGETLTVPFFSWSAGIYTLYINTPTASFEGEFELE